MSYNEISPPMKFEIFISQGLPLRGSVKFMQASVHLCNLCNLCIPVFDESSLFLAATRIKIPFPKRLRTQVLPKRKLLLQKLRF